MSDLDAIMTEIATTGRAQWIDACRRVQCSLAEISAARPRRPFEYYHFGLGRDLIEYIRKRPSEPSLCWPIIRGLCAYLRLATLDLRGDGFCPRYGVLHLGRGIPIENARILIRAELRRLVAARSQLPFEWRRLSAAPVSQSTAAE